jgi:hypothetical protein
MDFMFSRRFDNRTFPTILSKPMCYEQGWQLLSLLDICGIVIKSHSLQSLTSFQGGCLWTMTFPTSTSV